MTKAPMLHDRSCEHLRYRGVSLKAHVLASVPEFANSSLGDLVWKYVNEQCEAESNVLPLLISQIEPQPSPRPSMFERRGRRKPAGSDPFADLVPTLRLEARERFQRMCEKWEGNLPSWRRAILAGVTRRLVLNRPGPEWGKRMRRIKGGIHCQRKYRELGWHPLTAFNQAMAKRRKHLGRGQLRTLPLPSALQGPAEDARNRLGVTPEQMFSIPRITPILEPIKGGIESVIDSLRWSRPEADATAFLLKYDSIPPADLPYLSIEEVCVAAGVDPQRLLALATDALVTKCIQMATLEVALSLPEIMHATAKRALGPGGHRDARLVLQVAGLLPVRSGTQ